MASGDWSSALSVGGECVLVGTGLRTVHISIKLHSVDGINNGVCSGMERSSRVFGAVSPANSRLWVSVACVLATIPW